MAAQVVILAVDHLKDRMKSCAFGFFFSSRNKSIWVYKQHSTRLFLWRWWSLTHFERAGVLVFPCILILASKINILRNSSLIQKMKNYAVLLSVAHITSL